MMHTVLSILYVVLATIFYGTAAIIASFIDRSGNLPHRIARAWGGSILLAAGIDVTVKGVSNIDPDRSYIYMCNHQSNTDIPILLGRLPVQFRWLAKAELFKIPLFGKSMRGCGYISIDRSNRASAIRSLNEAARTIRDGASVMIFPEGTRSWDGRIHSFKKGGFVLAIKSGAPIAPIVIRGARAAMPKGSKRIRPGAVSLEILPPVETTDYKLKNKQALMDDIREIIMNTFENNNEESSKW
ncbi:MAG: 1-acyl-sn-glycerol-3-phosphate acyltransferase [Desulfobacterales bacterium]|nr:1-acyl-sn-glycerol-3-phosphate acyltransferase [Desulfobacterales bacterium]